MVAARIFGMCPEKPEVRYSFAAIIRQIHMAGRRCAAMDGDGIVMRKDGFLVDESGAVTVDFVVLTAAVVGMAILIFPALSTPTEELSDDIAVTIGKYKDFLQ
jgi:hypothetical protein